MCIVTKRTPLFEPCLTLSISLFAYSKGGTRNGKSYKSNSINVIEQWVDEFVFLDITVIWKSKNDATKNMWMSGFRLYDYVYLPEKLKVNVFWNFFFTPQGRSDPKLFRQKVQCIFTLQQIAIFFAHFRALLCKTKVNIYTDFKTRLANNHEN